MWESLLALLAHPSVLLLEITLLFKLVHMWADRRPSLQKFIDNNKGLLIHAIKFAEKEIPDGTVNKHLARLDEALKIVIDKAEGNVDEDTIKHAISKVHAEINHGVS